MIIKRVLLLVLISGLVTACSTLKSLTDFTIFDANDINSISVEADIDSNQNNPVGLDLVFIYDEKVNAILTKLNGPDWFRGKDGLIFQYKSNIDVVSLEVVSLTARSAVLLPEKYSDASKVLLFANYIDKKGQYSAELTAYQDLIILLKRNKYVLNELDE